jgi:hypothetical protein
MKVRHHAHTYLRLIPVHRCDFSPGVSQLIIGPGWRIRHTWRASPVTAVLAYNHDEDAAFDTEFLDAFRGGFDPFAMPRVALGFVRAVPPVAAFPVPAIRFAFRDPRAWGQRVMGRKRNSQTLYDGWTDSQRRIGSATPSLAVAPRMLIRIGQRKSKGDLYEKQRNSRESRISFWRK